jgi:eukaryotic-like serine/threonine-protein kinase
MQTLPAPREVILELLERILASDTFAGAERSRVLLRFLVEQALENHADRLKEYTIGSEAFGRGDSFDPRTDPIVRAEASRLRSRLQQYYATIGAADTLLITLPKGSYVPQIHTRDIPAAGPVTATTDDASSAAGRFQRFIWFVLGALTVGIAAVLFIWARRTEPPQAAEFPAIEFHVELGAADRSLGADIGNDVILSPDGTRIVFVALGSDHVSRLMTMGLKPGQGTVMSLPETEGARLPFFSPDGLRIGFWDDAKLKTISLDGGSPEELTDAENFGGGSWGKNDEIIAAIDGALRRVSLTSRAATVVADLREEGISPVWPDLLPGGSHVLFTALGQRGPDASTLELLSLSDRKRTPLPIRAGFGRYLRDGYLLYVNQGTLFAQPFDRKQLAVHGTPVPVLDQRVVYSTVFGNASFDISQNGTLIYRRSLPMVASWLARGGGIEPLLATPGAYTFPRLSLDGQRLAINVTDSGVRYTEVYDVRTKQNTRLPFAPGSMSPVWHPDGFLVVGSSDAGMSWMKVDDTSNVKRLTPTSNVQIPWSFTADGTRLAYAEASPSLDLWTIPVRHAGGELTVGNPERFLRTPYVESYPLLSPDGRWLVYSWGPQGKWNVFVKPFPEDGSTPIPVSQGGGRIPRWLPNGRQIVYRTDDHRLMVVDYEVKNGKFIVGTPNEWTDVRLANTGVIANFDVDPVTGDRILGLVPADRAEAERIKNQATVIVHFPDEVRRRLTAGAK